MTSQPSLFTVPDPIEGGWLGDAIYSPPPTPGAEPIYRYSLVRRWGASDTPLLRWIMLNPSTATETKLDPTLRRCREFSIREGFDGMLIQNAFALRSTDPAGLYTCPDPVGPDNDAQLLDPGYPIAAYTIVAWGVHATFRNRNTTVAQMLRDTGHDMRCLKLTKDGHPSHPLYIRSDQPLITYP